MMTLKNTLFATLAFALCGIAAQVSAVEIGPGATVATPGTTAAARPELNCTNIEDRARPFAFVSGGIVVKGEVVDRLVKQNRTGELDFYTLIRLDPASNASVTSMTRNNMGNANATLDVDWRSDSLGTMHSDQAIRSATGQYVTFSFANGISPGKDTHSLLIHTKSHGYDSGGTITLYWQQGLRRGAVPIPAFQPVY